jgi:hypothetical protein
MKNITLVFIAFIGLIGQNTFGQFEQKFTLHASVGYTAPYGPISYSYPMPGYEEEKPYLFSNFSGGTVLNFGVQYNANRNLSFGVKLRPLYLFSWEYSDENVNWSEYYEMSLFNLGLGINTKFKFLPSNKINPFLYGEISGNYTTLGFAYVSNTEGVDGPNERPAFLENSMGLGFNAGVGFDFSLNENLGAFIQGGINNIQIQNEDYNPLYYDGYLEKENFNTMYIEIGLNISFLKSKNI